MYLTKLHIQGFGVFKAASFGPLPQLAVFIGPNGSGKSTLLRVFDVMRDALRDGASAAFARQGGFETLQHQAAQGPIVFRFDFDTEHTYEVHFVASSHGIRIAHEELTRRGEGLLEQADGSGRALANEDERANPDADPEYEEFTTTGPGLLGLGVLGQLASFPSIAMVRTFFGSASAFAPHVDELRGATSARAPTELLPDASNLPAVLRELSKTPASLQRVIDFAARYVPGLQSAEAVEDLRDQLRLSVRERGHTSAFRAEALSTGTLKLLAYAAFIETPTRQSLVVLDEPETDLHHQALTEFYESLRQKSETGPQILVTTHATDFLAAATPAEVFVLSKRNGESTVLRAADDAQVCALVDAGDLLSALWRQNLLPGANP